MRYVDRAAWPPDYLSEIIRRQEAFRKLQRSAILQIGAKEYYKNEPHEFINDWAITYDPRKSGTDQPATMPFLMFQRQAEFVTFILQLLDQQESGICEKARDMGATWTAVSVCVWAFLFRPGTAIGWGSRKADLVDRIGDPDSIFEKMRIQLGAIPSFFMPVGFTQKTHATYMRIVNPENGNTITGESGDNIGRGGRKSVYFKDESAHYERPEMIQAALDDNTNVQIDISSVNGPGNVFYRRRQAARLYQGEIVRGKPYAFIMDWRDHPAKDQQWYDYRQANAREQGLLHKFEQEVNRNYLAAVEGIVIPSAWVNAAVDAHVKLGIEIDGRRYAGLDVADEGNDRNALVSRKGILCDLAEPWAQGDTSETTAHALRLLAPFGSVELEYDSVGVGAGVKGEANRLKREGSWPKAITLASWSAGSKVLDPDEHLIKRDKDTPLNKDFYANLKAQAWWQARLRFERTYRAITEPGFTYKPEDLISISSALPHLETLKTELSQATRHTDGKGKLLIDKSPDGVRSPNLADGFVMAYWPVPANDTMKLYAKLMGKT